MTEIITNLCSLEGLTQVRVVPSFEFCAFSVKIGFYLNRPFSVSLHHVYLDFCSPLCDNDVPSDGCFLLKLACMFTIHSQCPVPLYFLFILTFVLPSNVALPVFSFVCFLSKLKRPNKLNRCQFWAWLVCQPSNI